MRSLCASKASFWQQTPSQAAFGGLPYWMVQGILTDIIENDLRSKLHDHVCDSAAPCAALRREAQSYACLLQVCKAWSLHIRRITQDQSYARVLRPTPYSRAYDVIGVLHLSVGGRYRPFHCIEFDDRTAVFYADDYGSPDGCRAISMVALKFSNHARHAQTEHDVYKALESSCESSGDHVAPRLLHRGFLELPYHCDPIYSSFVLECLGPDLGRIKAANPQNKFTPKATLAVAIQTVRIYQKMHASGWLHVNAKPGNFAIGPAILGKCNKIYVFDFERSKQIKMIPEIYRHSATGGWNMEFVPVSWSLGQSPSHRDDMEGLAYVFSDLGQGTLPWRPQTSTSETWRVKVSTPTKDLFKGMDPVYVRYFNEVKTLAWGEIPDYDGMVQRFSDVWEREGYGGTPGDIDWWEELLLRKVST